MADLASISNSIASAIAGVLNAIGGLRTSLPQDYLLLILAVVALIWGYAGSKMFKKANQKMLADGIVMFLLLILVFY